MKVKTKNLFIIFTLFIFLIGNVFADVSIHINVPDYKKGFGIKVKGGTTTRISFSIPECLGNLGFAVKEGYDYTVSSDKNCVMRVTYHKSNDVQSHE